ncbi:hypothetical protein [Pseudomonas nitroreducens]|uniref:hypothetical protein n=1 Tax=Pseudomonas nitroreducens TaxID=46680 RepID=UPI00265AA7E0|nr:hypothetical protein [Pseudomonas nitroreducens]MCP1652700.1 hypothetical protein [Pseudomonas nitroreducens]
MLVDEVSAALQLKSVEDFTQAVESLGVSFGSAARSMRSLLEAGEKTVTVGMDFSSESDRQVLALWARMDDKSHLQGLSKAKCLGRYLQALSIEQADWLAKAGHNLRRSRRLHLHKLLRYECRAVFGRG